MRDEEKVADGMINMWRRLNLVHSILRNMPRSQIFPRMFPKWVFRGFVTKLCGFYFSFGPLWENGGGDPIR